MKVESFSLKEFIKKYQFLIGVISTLLMVFFFFFPNIVTLNKPTFNPGRSYRAQLVGKWYGEAATRDMGTRYWLSDFREDGTFRITFKNVSISGEETIHMEEGVWGSSGDVQFTITRSLYDIKGENEKLGKIQLERSDAYGDDAYQILSVDRQFLEYTSLETGHTYKTRRMKTAFELIKIPK